MVENTGLIAMLVTAPDSFLKSVAKTAIISHIKALIFLHGKFFFWFHSIFYLLSFCLTISTLNIWILGKVWMTPPLFLLFVIFTIIAYKQGIKTMKCRWQYQWLGSAQEAPFAPVQEAFDTWWVEISVAFQIHSLSLTTMVLDHGPIEWYWDSRALTSSQILIMTSIGL